MRELFKDLKSVFREMNKISRTYIKYGNIAVFTSFVLALFCALSAGRMGNGDYLLFMRDELFSLGKEMLGAIYVPALMIEIVVLAEKTDRKN